MLSAIRVMPDFAKIISGGQTGVDRAALDAALKHGIDCGGWCPPGRLDEFGKIPDHYPLKEIKEGRSPDRPSPLEAAPWKVLRDSFAQRTRQNVKDSGGSAIIYSGELRAGTQKTLSFCLEEKRPHLLIDAMKISADQAAELIGNFVRDKRIGTLNVAGPRQSEWPEGYGYASQALDFFLSRRRDVLPHVRDFKRKA